MSMAPATKKVAKKKAAAKKPGRTASAAKKPVARKAAVKKSATTRDGRGARWTDAQVKQLMETVAASPTAKHAFEQVAKDLGKSVGTVQQKYYNVQKKSGAPTKRRRGRPVGSTNQRTATPAPRVATASTTSILSAAELRTISIDELVSLASRVRAEVDRRRRELDQATKLFG
jgi:hypothetical protein